MIQINNNNIIEEKLEIVCKIVLIKIKIILKVVIREIK